MSVNQWHGQLPLSIYLVTLGTRTGTLRVFTLANPCLYQLSPGFRNEGVEWSTTIQHLGLTWGKKFCLVCKIVPSDTSDPFSILFHPTACTGGCPLGTASKSSLALWFPVERGPEVAQRIGIGIVWTLFCPGPCRISMDELWPNTKDFFSTGLSCISSVSGSPVQGTSFPLTL